MFHSAKVQVLLGVIMELCVHAGPVVQPVEYQFVSGEKMFGCAYLPPPTHPPTMHG